METIKKEHEAQADAIIDPFLTQVPGATGYAAENLYKKFSGERKRNLVNNVLLPEQQHRCCYCMKHLAGQQEATPSEATIEHVVPQRVAQEADLQPYFNYHCDGLNAENVCLTSKYIDDGNHFPPYPHALAYHNIVIACKQCNNHRRDRKIAPLFFFPNIHGEVSYNPITGAADWPNDPLLRTDATPTLVSIGITRPHMQALRAICFYVRQNHRTISENTDRQERAVIVDETIGNMLQAGYLDDEVYAQLENFKLQEKWNELLKYDYFYAWDTPE